MKISNPQFPTVFYFTATIFSIEECCEQTGTTDLCSNPFLESLLTDLFLSCCSQLSRKPSIGFTRNLENRVYKKPGVQGFSTKPGEQGLHETWRIGFTRNLENRVNTKPGEQGLQETWRIGFTRNLKKSPKKMFHKLKFLKQRNKNHKRLLFKLVTKPGTRIIEGN